MSRPISRTQQGFTIVELLIVVVVIAILAAITIVAYNGIQDRARASALSSDVSGNVKKLELARVESGTDTYPSPASYSPTASNGTTMTYLLPTPDTYCVSATNGSSAIGMVKGKSPVEGVCTVNVVKNPTGAGAASGYWSSGWFTPLGTTTDTANVSWNGKTNWHRFVWSGSGNGIMRMNMDLADLENGQPYIASVLVGNNGTATMTIALDFTDLNTTTFNIAPNEMRRINVTATRAEYTSIYRFIDIDSTTPLATGLLVSDVMLTKGSTPTQYADGSSNGWTWTGVANASKSVGPVR